MANQLGNKRYGFTGPNGETGYAFGANASEAKAKFAARIKTTVGRVKQGKTKPSTEAPAATTSDSGAI